MTLNSTSLNGLWRGWYVRASRIACLCPLTGHARSQRIGDPVPTAEFLHVSNQLKQALARARNPLGLPPPLLSKHWLQRFLKRRPCLSLTGGVLRHEERRLRQMTAATLVSFHMTMVAALETIAKKGWRMFGYASVDEMGCSGADIKGRPCRGKYIGVKGIP